MVKAEALSKQISELKAKQASGTLTQEEATLLSELEQQYAESLEQASAEELQQIAESAAESAGKLVSPSDFGFFTPAMGVGALGLAGGGGGGGGSSIASLGSSFSGQLVNGYIKDALVYQDNNGNGSFDSGEPSGTTNSLGQFTLGGFVSGAGEIVAQPTWTNSAGETVSATDQTTGATVSTVFRAPVGSTVISPLSTLMSAGATQDQIKQAFDLDASIDLTSFDPIAAATATGASAADIEAALNIKAASTSVSNILDVASESLGSAGVNADNASQTAANVITSKLTTSGFSLADSTIVEDTLVSIFNESEATIDSNVAASLGSSLGAKIATANTATFNAASSGAIDALEQIYKAAKTAQVGLAASASAVLEADDASAALADLDQFDVDTEIASASIPNNDEFGGLDFELEASEYQIDFFGGASGSLLTDPTDSSNAILTFVRTPESKFYSGVILGYLTGSTVDEIPINADEGETTINARIWSPSDGVVARMEIADSSAVSAQNMYFNVHAEATLNSGWNDVVFDFASPVVRFVDEANGSLATPIASEATYDKLSLFIDWNNSKDFAGNEMGTAITEDVTYYVDNVVMGFGNPVYYQGGSGGSSIAPTAAPEAPTADAADVVSLFSDTYTAATTATWSTSWDDADVADVELGGNAIKKYTNVSFIGIEPAATIDASSSDVLNISVWRTNATADLKIKLVDFADGVWNQSTNVEHEINLAASGDYAVAAGQWVDLSLNLSDFTGLTRTDNIAQIIISSHKYDDDGNAVGSGETLYIDNMYFGPSGPTAAPEAPTADAADVVSLFSDTYTAATTATWSTSWDDADVADVDRGGNAIKKYTNVSFIGIEPAATIDASSSDVFNISVWRTDATADLKIKLVDFADGVWNQSTNVEHEINLAASGDYAVAAGQWVDLSLNLSDFTGLTRTDNIAQIIISSHKYDDDGNAVGSGETLYIDNMYFGPSGPTAAPEAPTADAADVVSLFSDTYTAATTATWSTSWDDADVADVDRGGNAIKKYTNVSFIGIEPAATIDASSSDVFNISVWRTDATADLKIKLVDFADGVWNQSTNVEHEINLAASGDYAVAAGQWVDLSLNLSDFTGLTRTDNIAQIIISSNKYDDDGNAVGSGETLYIDNMYFGPSGPTAAPEAPTADAADVVSLFSDTYTAATTATWSTSWDDADVADVDRGGNAIKKYTNVSFIGIEPAATIDASSSDVFNISVWRTDATADLKIKLVDFADGVWNQSTNVEHEINLAASGDYAVAAGQWVDLSLNLSDFTGLTRTDNIAQIIISSNKYDDDGNAVGSGETLYIDNMYFETSGPTAAPEAPTADAADVVSLFSDTYTAATTATWSTSWDDADVADVELGGNAIKKYTNVSFIGIEPAATIDASSSDVFNISVWRTDATADLKIKLVDFADGVWNQSTNVEHEINLAASGDYAVAAGQWVDLSLNLSDFTGLTRTDNIAQIIISSNKYDDDGNAVGSGETLYIDNMYFETSGPTAAPEAPTADAADVVSLFSDTYTAATTATWSTSWDDADVADVELGGNAIKKYTNVSFIGIEPAATIDASSSDVFNISVWRTDATADLKIKLVDFADGVWNQSTNVEHEINLAASGDYAVAAGQWVDLSLNLSDFTGLTRTDNIAQIIISSNKYDDDGNAVGSGETLYIDNMYFGPSGPTAAPEAPTADAADVVSLFSDTYTAATTATWSTSWDDADVADVDLGGNAIKKYTNVSFIGIEPAATIDASSSDVFNISVWRTDATADLKIKLVDFADGVWNQSTNVEHEINLAASGDYAVAAGQWVDLSLNLSDFTGLTRTDNIAQIIISSNKYDDDGNAVGSGETLYIDNMYFETSPAISESPSSPADLTNYTLVFEDEFNTVGASPNSTNWAFDTGNDGWGNSEVQDYQSGSDDAQIIDWDTSSEVNGALRITAKNVDGTITSARVKSDIDVGPYGYYEVRAKLPSENGAWPAIWLLGEGGRSTWPDDGEIDLVEWSSAYASGDTEIISALHYPAANGGNANDTNATLTSAVDEWHTYQLWWTPDSIKIGVDGTEADAHLVYSKPENATNNTWPYDGPMDLILNIAIGGTLGGTVPTSNFEYAMDVDYVRIYQIDGTEADVTPTELTLTFDANDGSGYALADFGGNVSSIVTGTDAPSNSDGSVVKVQKGAGAQTWAGTTFFDLSGDGELISDGGTIVTADVFSAKDGATVRLKLEDSSDSTIYVELDATTESNGAEAWEELSWDLSTATGLDHSNNYDKAAIFFDFGTTGDDEVYYLDNVNFSGYIA